MSHVLDAAVVGCAYEYPLQELARTTASCDLDLPMGHGGHRFPVVPVAAEIRVLPKDSALQLNLQSPVAHAVVANHNQRVVDPFATGYIWLSAESIPTVRANLFCFGVVPSNPVGREDLLAALVMLAAHRHDKAICAHAAGNAGGRTGPFGVPVGREHDLLAFPGAGESVQSFEVGVGRRLWLHRELLRS